MACTLGDCIFFALLLSLASLSSEADSKGDQAGSSLGLQPRQEAPWIEIVSWSPRAAIYHSFLTHEECDHLIKAARPLVSRSTVVKKDGAKAVDDVRTSRGTFLRKGYDAVVARIDRRVAEWTHLPEENAEDLQILQYNPGEKYDYHYDANATPAGKAAMETRGVKGGFRTATVLMYLSDVEEGGETAFPQGTWLDSARQPQGGFSKCASQGVAVHPKKGDAILFWSLHPDGRTMDKSAFHSGCPVIRGVKWSATKWIRVERFGLPGLRRQQLEQQQAQQQQAGSGGGGGGMAPRLAMQGGGQRAGQGQGGGGGGGGGDGRGRGARGAPLISRFAAGGSGGGLVGGCRDLDERCERWAARGECTRNPEFMVGGTGRAGRCRRACGACRQQQQQEEEEEEEQRDEMRR